MESMNTLTMCRLCLCENECFINIFKLSDYNSYVAAEIISDLLRLQVSENDGYPHVVCSGCNTKLTEFKIFKEQCQTSKATYDSAFPTSFVVYLPDKVESNDERESTFDDKELQTQDPLREIKEESVDIMEDENEADYAQLDLNKDVEALENVPQGRKLQRPLRNPHPRPESPLPPNRTKRRRVMSLECKLELIRRMEMGVTAESLARDYDLRGSSIRTIKRMAAKIKEAVARSTPLNAKITARLRHPLVEKMEKFLSTWIEQQRKALGIAEVREKALDIYEKLEREEGRTHGNKPFVASRGWYANFRARQEAKNIKAPMFVKKGEANTRERKRSEVWKCATD